MFFIPVDVRNHEIAAAFKDGMLTLTLPKKPMERTSQAIQLN
ncbi:MAG: Hsp20 family protein [Cyclobacteriaceae bacterium]|nr:Hsp20 family protein [Cyclobacteriaceae bacterium]